MNFWATIEHSLNYKYKGQFPEDIQNASQRAAEAAFRLDEEMSLIRGEIQEAQVFFQKRKPNKKDKKIKSNRKGVRNEICNNFKRGFKFQYVNA